MAGYLYEVGRRPLVAMATENGWGHSRIIEIIHEMSRNPLANRIVGGAGQFLRRRWHPTLPTSGDRHQTGVLGIDSQSVR